jgi:predicted enzyme related to lactoylglutathione lyase
MKALPGFVPQPGLRRLCKPIHPEAIMSSNPVRWFEIYVQDMERAKRFYEAVFQVQLQRLEAPLPGMEFWAFPMSAEGYGAGGALVKIEGVPSGGCGTLVYFASEDCAVEAARAVEHGGSIHREKTPIGPFGYIALVTDTEGNLIGIHTS